MQTQTIQINQPVLITWGTYKGQTATVTATRYTKNVIVKLDSTKQEIELSMDHIETIQTTEAPANNQTVLTFIQSLLGDNYTIKSKKVANLVYEPLYTYKAGEGIQKGIHYFTINKPYKVNGITFNTTTIKATQLKSGVWRITE